MTYAVFIPGDAWEVDNGYRRAHTQYHVPSLMSLNLMIYNLT